MQVCSHSEGPSMLLEESIEMVGDDASSLVQRASECLATFYSVQQGFVLQISVRNRLAVLGAIDVLSFLYV